MELTGIAAAGGVLAAGMRVETAGEVVVADGSADYVISASGASPGLGDRRRLLPADEEGPQVVYFADEAAMLAALADGGIDAIARGEVGNLDAARIHGDAFAVTALDERAEVGGFALAVEDAELAECLDRHIAWVTDNGRIGVPGVARGAGDLPVARPAVEIAASTAKVQSPHGLGCWRWWLWRCWGVCRSLGRASARRRGNSVEVVGRVMATGSEAEREAGDRHGRYALRVSGGSGGRAVEAAAALRDGTRADCAASLGTGLARATRDRHGGRVGRLSVWKDMYAEGAARRIEKSLPDRAFLWSIEGGRIGRGSTQHDVYRTSRYNRFQDRRMGRLPDRAIHDTPELAQRLAVPACDFEHPREPPEAAP